MTVNRYDIIPKLFGLGVLALGLTCIYGAFWWFNTYIPPFYGLTLMDALEMPVLNIVFAVMSFWIVPSLGVAGIGIIIGLVWWILD